MADGTKRGELDKSVAAGTEASRMERGCGGRALSSCAWQPRLARPAVGWGEGAADGVCHVRLTSLAIESFDGFQAWCDDALHIS